jgi:hypothetical protein
VKNYPFNILFIRSTNIYLPRLKCTDKNAQTTTKTQKEMSKRLKNDEFDTNYWRERFKALLKQCPKNWMKSLVQHNTEFDSYESTMTMFAVKRGRAGLQKTREVVLALEEMTKAPKPAQKSVFERWKSKTLVK